MSGEHDQPVRAPWVKEGPEEAPPERRVSTPESDAVMLGFLPQRVDVGTVAVGSETIAEIARPTLMNGAGALVTTLSQPEKNIDYPSAFRDQLGLDPEPMRDASDAQSFALVSQPMIPIGTYGSQSHVVRVRFKPNRGGRLSTVVTIKAVGKDGSIDSKQIRVTAFGKPPPSVVDEVSLPDPAKGVKPRPPKEPMIMGAGGGETVRREARFLANMQLSGVELAQEEVKHYKKAAPPRSDWTWIIELAISMGVAGIAGLVAKLAARKLLGAVVNRNHLSTGAISGETPAEPIKPDEQWVSMLSESLKDGMKNAVKKPPTAPAKPSTTEPSGDSEALSADPLIAFFTRHKIEMRKLERTYENTVAILEGQLGDATPEVKDAALMAIGEAFHGASPTGAELQARATEFQWVSATAKEDLGAHSTKLPDGSTYKTTNLDGAHEFGEHGPMAVPMGVVPKHDGVLDIRVEMPLDKMPVESGDLIVRGASLIGISNLIAERLRNTDLSAAGVPIRLIVDGHAALITRDEIGNVRVNGYLRTQDGTKWSEAHMHKGAKHVMNRVLAKSLAEWGVSVIETDDASKAPSK